VAGMQKISMYEVTVPEFVKAIENISRCIDKAELYAKENNFNIEILTHFRLYPDMFDFISQVRNGCWVAVDCVQQMAGRGDIVKKDPREETLSELKETIMKSLEFLKSVKPEELEGSEEKTITYYFDREKSASAVNFVTKYIHPNFYFHMAVAYVILRHNGVRLGKDDYIGDYGMKSSK
jgi:uncharacterized protein